MRLKFIITGGFALGAFFGISATIGFVLLLGGSVQSELVRYGTYGISAIVTLLAASLAFSLEATRRRRSLAAANATLPLALSHMILICRRGIEISLNNNCEGHSEMELVQQVQFSSEILVTLEKCIEFADEGSGERLAGIIRTYQVLIARMQSRHFTRSITGEERQRASEAVNWAILYRRIEDVFKYARGEVNKIPTILTEPNTHGIFYVSMRLSHNHPLSLELDGAIASTKIHKALN